MEKAAQLQMQIKENSNELNDFLKDLTRWEEKVKKEDEHLRTTRRIDEKLPPVRKGKKETVRKEDTNNNGAGLAVKKQPANQEKIKSYDYDAWSKFDVEAACKEVDETEKSSDEDDEEEDEEEIGKIEEERKMQQAAMEKDKGNQLFKEGKYEAAINRYTIAIGLHTTSPIFYANRGMALLKMERYGAAEQDCSFALELDPEYTKAYARRATARYKMKKFLEALEDFKNVLKYEPTNKQALAEVQNIQKILDSITEQKRTKKAEKKREEAKTGENGTVPKRKKRSNKPLKRIHIQEIGLSDDEEEERDNRKDQTNQPTPSVVTQSNSRVPPLHSTKDVVMDTPLTTPTSSFLFETEFKRIRNDQETLYKYLKMIPCDQYTKLFHQCIDVLISSFLKTLLVCYVRDKLEVHNELQQFSKINRFSMAVMFLSKNDKQVLRDLFTYIGSEEYAGKLSNEWIAELRKVYGVK